MDGRVKGSGSGGKTVTDKIDHEKIVYERIGHRQNRSQTKSITDKTSPRAVTTALRVHVYDIVVD
jgi:hypothetical protein